MSNLCHLDVEHGRLTRRRTRMARALRISEERDIPICTMWQLGVRARLRLLQGRWPEAEDDARARARAGRPPPRQALAQLVLGLLAARRDAPPENPHLDELWCLAKGLGNPGQDRCRPRSHSPSRRGSCGDPIRGSPTPASPPSSTRAADAAGPARSGRGPAGWPRRGAAGARAGRRRSRWPPPRRHPTSRPSPAGTTTPPTPCWRRSRCWTTWARAPSGRCSAAGCGSWA